MRKTLVTILILAFLALMQNFPAAAIENGESALGNQFVVPIAIQISSNPDSWISCSGALVTPNVVATAGHCVLDSSGLVSKQILVGPPGSQLSVTESWAKAIQTYTDENYRGPGINGLLTSSDIAFLVIDKTFTQNTKIYFASENSLNALKISSARLRIIGYGITSDAGAPNLDPHYLDSTFQNESSSDPNQSFAVSSKGGICKGDSGGPVLSITPTRVTLLGIVLGSRNLGVKCAGRDSSGQYSTTFTAINRYANLTVEAMTDAFSNLQVSVNDSKKNSDETINLRERVDSLEQQVSELQSSFENANQETIRLKAIVSAFTRAGYKSLVCTNKVSTKTVVGKTPVCPKGFKIEK